MSVDGRSAVAPRAARWCARWRSSSSRASSLILRHRRAQRLPQPPARLRRLLLRALAGLTVLAGVSGQISLGHGALMAVGAYTVALLIGNEGWALLPALVAAVVAARLVGIPVGAAASRLRGPYLAGATLAFAVGLPALADKFPATFGGENGLTINPPTPPSWLGANFPLERWEAWIACAGALVVLFVLYNLIHSGDRAIAARRARRRDRRRAVRACASAGRRRSRSRQRRLRGARRRAAARSCCSSRTPGAFPLQLSLSLLTGVVLGGLGSLVGAIWGAALLVLLPNWTNDLANSFSLSTNVSHNLPLAIYGLVLIGAMLVWPSGIQGGVRAIAHGVGPAIGPARAAGSARRGDATEPAKDEEVKTSQPERVSRRTSADAAARAARASACARRVDAPRRGRNPEQRRLDLAQPLVIAADPDRGVVVEERIGETHDRVRERRRIDARLVATGGDLGLDQRLHARHRPRLDDAGARGQHPHRAVPLLLEQPAHRPRARQRAVDVVEHLEQPGGAAAPAPGPLARDEQLELRGRSPRRAAPRATRTSDRSSPGRDRAAPRRPSGRRAGRRGTCSVTSAQHVVAREAVAACAPCRPVLPPSLPRRSAIDDS